MDLSFKGRGIIASKATGGPPICAKKRPLDDLIPLITKRRYVPFNRERRRFGSLAVETERRRVECPALRCACGRP